MESKDAIIICDFEESYCVRLDEYIRQRLKLSFKIYDFTSKEIFDKESKKLNDKAFLLIISGKAYKECDTKDYTNILILNEDENNIFDIQDEDIKVCITKKYQSIDAILEKIYELCMDADTLKISNENIKKAKIHTVYSPVCRCGKTNFAKSLSGNLSKSARTLYINLESFSGYSMNNRIRDIKESADEINIDFGAHEDNLQDLIYYFLNDKSKMKLYLEKISVNKYGFDEILPAKSFLALKGIEDKHITGMIDSIVSCGVYENIVIDLSETICGFLDILDMSDIIFIPYINDNISIQKVNEYEKVMRLSGYTKTADKGFKFEIPRSFENVTFSDVQYTLFANYIYNGARESIRG